MTEPKRKHETHTHDPKYDREDTIPDDEREHYHVVAHTKIEFHPTDDETTSTAVLSDEDHTMGNALRFVLVRNPKVEFAGYSVPHPAENKVHVRIQTRAGENGQKVFREGIETLISICDHIDQTFDNSERTFFNRANANANARPSKDAKSSKAKS